MGLESGQFISDLVNSWPLPTDRRREGDDHLRLIKTTLQNTFPNLNAAVTATPKQLNSLPSLSVKDHITELKKHVVPKGTVVMWSGTQTSIPAGWALCNGQDVEGFGEVPDLRERFILAAGTNIPVGTTGGGPTATTTSSGSHQHDVDGHALTIAQMPSHAHRLYACSGTSGSSGVNAFGAGDVATIGDIDNTPRAFISVNGASKELIEVTGAGQAHTHTMQAAGAHTHAVTITPIFYALAFIIKVIAYVDPPA